MSGFGTKQCPGCGTKFTLKEIVEGGSVRPIGMKFDDPDLRWNMYYFVHDEAYCGTTFAIPVTRFLPFINEPIPGEVLAGSAECGQHCLRADDTTECHATCLYAPFRRFLLKLMDQPVESEHAYAGEFFQPF